MSAALRFERASDIAAIAEVVRAAFRGHPHSRGGEAGIVDRLRALGHLAHSIVADAEGHVVGHLALSRVDLSPVVEGWYGLGPLSVLPMRQGTGIGSALVSRGLDDLRAAGAAGCVVLGHPAFYGRFGFRSCETLSYRGGPAWKFLALAFRGAVPHATVAYSAAFHGA